MRLPKIHVCTEKVVYIHGHGSVKVMPECRSELDRVLEMLEMLEMPEMLEMLEMYEV